MKLNETKDFYLIKREKFKKIQKKELLIYLTNLLQKII